MGAILLAVTGPRSDSGGRNASRALAPQRDRPAIGRSASAIRADIAYACVWQAPRGLLASLPQPRGDLLARRRRRSCSERSRPAGCAGRAHRRSRSHHADDRIRRAARAHASSPPAALRRPATRAPLARARPAAGERGRGRRDGPRRARPRCRGGAAPARLSRRGLEPHAEDDCRGSRPFTARTGSTPFSAAPRFWSACCRRRRRRTAFCGSTCCASSGATVRRAAPS